MPRGIIVEGARVHNLANITLEIPRHRLVAVCGVSGSGKSSLAFDTLYAEGHRIYLGSLSSYARQFLGDLARPDVDRIEGISPTIAIDQSPLSRNPRSTVGTSTEILDHLRVLYGRLAEAWCPDCGVRALAQDPESILAALVAGKAGKRLVMLAPLARGRKGEFKNLLTALATEGYGRVRVDGAIYSLDEEISLAKSTPHDLDLVVDRVVMPDTDEGRVRRAVSVALQKGDGILVALDADSGRETTYSERATCPKCARGMPPLSPRLFSFNAPEGACPRCKGIGVVEDVDYEALIDPERTLVTGGLRPLRERLLDRWYQACFRGVTEALGGDPAAPLSEMPPKILRIIVHGSGDEPIAYTLRSRRGRRFSFNHPVRGLAQALWKKLSTTRSPTIRTRIQRYIRQMTCPDCGGDRLRPEALAARFMDTPFATLGRWSLADLLCWVQGAAKSAGEDPVAEPLLGEVSHRLRFLVEVGVGYLGMMRLSSTLSGGEAKRIRLARQLGGRLSGVLYILDEPSIGLHAEDTKRLVASLRELVNLDNSVLVVEHDPETINSADWLVELGPGAGEQGGRIVFEGRPAAARKDPASLIGPWLQGTPHPLGTPRALGEPLLITGARLHNLQEVDVAIPTHGLVVVTGVSGAGKSSLVEGVLAGGVSELDRHGELPSQLADSITGIGRFAGLRLIDQSPIGRTPRSNPATYTDLFTTLRGLFARCPEAQAEGMAPGFFSFNVRGGRCEACKGAGVKEIEMHFLPDVTVPCPVCQGSRFGPEALAVRYNGHNIAEVLAMTVDRAAEVFANHPPLARRFRVLRKVGLGYMRLGQPATTLSGGEAQRLKLSRALGRRTKGDTLLLLDEPTTGLHPLDIERLLEVFGELVDEGHTLVVIEHNMQVVAAADWVLELGPGGGDQGGRLVAEGPPAAILAEVGSPTGRALARWVDG